MWIIKLHIAHNYGLELLEGAHRAGSQDSWRLLRSEHFGSGIDQPDERVLVFRLSDAMPADALRCQYTRRLIEPISVGSVPIWRGLSASHYFKFHFTSEERLKRDPETAKR